MYHSHILYTWIYFVHTYIYYNSITKKSASGLRQAAGEVVDHSFVWGYPSFQDIPSQLILDFYLHNLFAFIIIHNCKHHLVLLTATFERLRTLLHKPLKNHIHTKKNQLDILLQEYNANLISLNKI